MGENARSRTAPLFGKAAIFPALVNVVLFFSGHSAATLWCWIAYFIALVADICMHRIDGLAKERARRLEAFTVAITTLLSMIAILGAFVG